jgi:hypothetical protein
MLRREEPHMGAAFCIAVAGETQWVSIRMCTAQVYPLTWGGLPRLQGWSHTKQSWETSATLTDDTRSLGMFLYVKQLSDQLTSGTNIWSVTKKWISSLNPEWSTGTKSYLSHQLTRKLSHVYCLRFGCHYSNKHLMGIILFNAYINPDHLV